MSPLACSVRAHPSDSGRTHSSVSASAQEMEVGSLIAGEDGRIPKGTSLDKRQAKLR